MIVKVLSDLDGRLLAVSQPAPGRTHDRNGFSLTGYDQLLAEVPTIGDLGYQGTHVIRPVRNAQATNTPASPSHRAAVERTISHWKNWKSSPPATPADSPNAQHHQHP